MKVEVRVTVGVTEHEQLAADELREIESLVPGSRATTEPGEVGVGAAGYGITVVLEIAERIMNDFGSLVGLGLALREWIKHRADKNDRTATISDSNTFAAIAASALPESWRDSLTVADYRGCQPLFGKNPPPHWTGTDSRDMWVASFSQDGTATHVFLSPSGMVLGYVRVPFEIFFNGAEWVQRTSDDVNSLFEQWNRRK